MPFAPHYRVSFGGSLSESGVVDEIWNCTVNCADRSSEAPGFSEDDYLNDINGPLKTWFSSLDAGNSSKATLEYVKCNLINAEGNYNSDDSHTFFYATPFGTGFAAPKYPQIITTAVSWGTTRARGPGAHGRIYPPNNTFDDATTLEMSAANQTALVRAGQALLTALNNTPGGNTLHPVVASKVDASLTDIIEVLVGSVKDVQRRRKDALVEVYQKGLFAPGD